MPSSEASYYDDYWRGASGWTPSDTLDPELWSWMNHLFTPGRRLLDVGCGDGARGAEAMKLIDGAKIGVELFGIDISPMAVEKARARGMNAAQGSLDDPLPFKDNEFDGILCLEVLQHLHHPEFAVREMARVLRPSGLLMVTVPNVANWRSRFDMLFFGRFRSGGSPLNVRYPWRDPHLRMFNMKSLADLMSDCGLTLRDQAGLHTNFLGQAPGIRRLTRSRAFTPVNRTAAALGRIFPSLLAGRCLALAAKPT